MSDKITISIDLEDAEQVGRLRDLIINESSLSAALREFANPEVYSHIVVMRDGFVHQALCGRVWRTTATVTTAGKCPTCRDLAGEWVA